MVLWLVLTMIISAINVIVSSYLLFFVPVACHDFRNVLVLSLLFCCFTSTVNSYGHVGTVSNQIIRFLGRLRPPNRLTSIKYVYKYFRQQS